MIFLLHMQLPEVTLPSTVQGRGKSAELGHKSCFVPESALWLTDVQILAVCRAPVATEK